MNPEISFASPPRRIPDQSEAFATLLRYFRDRHRAPDPTAASYRLTALGAWAASRAPHVFSFFRRMELGRYALFLDLGSGNGLVACIAGLFTRAVGIEIDLALCDLAQSAARDLGLAERVSFIRGDYRQLPIQRADCLYHYPDKPMWELEKLLADWRGDLLIYGPHFPLETMVPALRLACGRERLVLYRNA